VLTELWAEKAKDLGFEGIKFFSMHPGWSDTPAVRTAMPGFYEVDIGNVWNVHS